LKIVTVVAVAITIEILGKEIMAIGRKPTGHTLPHQIAVKRKRIRIQEIIRTGGQEAEAGTTTNMKQIRDKINGIIRDDNR